MTREWAGRLPKAVKVAAFDFAVEIWQPPASQASHRFGECSPVEMVIRVSADFASLMKMVDTVLHEVNHAIYWSYGIEDEDKEERIVGTMATAWTQVWRDNPLLLDWVHDAMKEMR